ncbi:MAG: rRNA (uracil1498-N3)-methyltransferase [Candidatus Sumerlaeota bacterium]|nr:rRNA (uracil1498-N3)-methyltransferase [Candidatus Sumerlaeota bacterium]
MLAPEEAAHLSKVRRVRDGQELLVLDGRGTEARAVATDARKGALDVREITRREESPGPPMELALALTRTGAFEDAIARAVELGATVFRPIETEHTVVRLDERKRAARHERWRRLAIERLKQCERLWLPVLHDPVPLAVLVGELETAGTIPVALIERSGVQTPLLGEVVRQSADAALCLIVGPEGGWNAGEAGLLASGRCRAASLGDAILRAETAALAAMALAADARLSHVRALLLPDGTKTASTGTP